jgi:hypothetical protein
MSHTITVAPRERHLSAEQRRALKLLASGRHGVNEELLVHSHDFRRPTIVGLIRAGLAAADREIVKAGGKPIEVVRVRITAAGRRAIEG